MKHNTDLTTGSISRHFLRLAAPLIMGNILQQLYNTVDALILGRFAGDAEFAASGIAGAVMNLFLFMIAGACTGISVILAQLYGADNIRAFRREHWISLSFGIAAASVISLIGLLLLSPILRLIKTPDSLMAYTVSYLRIIMLSLPASFLYNLYNAILRSIGRAGAALLALAAAVSANLLFDYYFVAVLGLGITGAALATAISQALAAVLCIIYLFLKEPKLIVTGKDLCIDSSLLKRTAYFSLVTGLHQSSLYIGKLLVQGAVNTGGTEMISAYTATTRIEGFANSFGDSGSSAASVLTAQNLGADNKGRVKRIFRCSLLIMALTGIITSAIMYLSSGVSTGFVLGKYSGYEYESAKSYIRMISLFYTFCFIGNAFSGYFDGIGRVLVPFFGSASHIALRVLISWLLVEKRGLNAVSLATGIGWIFVNALWACIKLRSDSDKHFHAPSSR